MEPSTLWRQAGKKQCQETRYMQLKLHQQSTHHTAKTRSELALLRFKAPTPSNIIGVFAKTLDVGKADSESHNLNDKI